MTTVVDKIACRSSTACPPPIVLRLFITDTISSATICSQYVKILRMRQKHDKFSCHNCRTTARWTEKPAYTTYNSTASEDDVPRASLHSRTLTVHELKVLSRNHDHHSPTLKFLMTDTHKYTSLHNYKHIHNQSQAVQEKKG